MQTLSQSQDSKISIFLIDLIKMPWLIGDYRELYCETYQPTRIMRWVRNNDMG